MVRATFFFVILMSVSIAIAASCDPAPVANEPPIPLFELPPTPDDGNGFTGEIQSCSDNTNPSNISPPATDYQRGKYRFSVETGKIMSFEGDVISIKLISKPGAIDMAIFLGTGGFLHEGCITTHKGTSYQWKGAACQELPGTLFNVFAVEPESLAAITTNVKVGETVRVSGYRITKFTDFSPGGGYWTPGGLQEKQGQVALWITDICKVN